MHASFEEARDDASYWLNHSGKARLPPPAAINLIAVLAMVMGLAGGIALSAYLIQRAPSIAKPAPADAPVGIRGWLLLPALQTYAMPVAMGMVVFAYWPYLNIHTWNDIASAQGEVAIQLLKLGYFLLISGACALLVASCAELYLLILWRRAYPVAFIVMAWSAVLWSILEALVSFYLPGEDAETPVMLVASTLGDCLAAALWTAYMLKSARVAATFVRESKARDPKAGSDSLRTEAQVPSAVP